MKIAIAQLNFRVGDIENNTRKIIAAIGEAKQQGAELVVFSQLSVCGYSPFDLLTRASFLQEIHKAVEEISGHCHGIAAIVGAPIVNHLGLGRPLFNSALFIAEGKVVGLHNKTHISYDYGLMEGKYFEEGKVISVVTFNQKRIGIAIGSDLSNEYVGKKLLEASLQKSPDVIIHLDAVPFTPSGTLELYSTLKALAKQYGLPILHVNQVGGNGDMIYEGASMGINEKGFMAVQLKSFAEDMQLVDIDSDLFNLSQQGFSNNQDIQAIHDALVLGIKDFFSKSGFSKATLGLSGGIDSAVALVLAQRAIGSENIRVLLLPSEFSSEHSVTDAKQLAQNLGVEYDVISISEIFESFNSGLQSIFAGLPNDVTEENLQARIRGVLLMALSNKLGHLLLNASNKSEAAVGYGTLYGDMCGALAVLADVYKSDVYKLAHYINQEDEVIPQNIISKPPSAELRPDQKDTDSLPEYSVLDTVLKEYIENNRSEEEIVAMGFDLETTKRIIKLVNSSEHKRYQSAPVLMVSSSGLGRNRLFPLVMKI